MIRYGVTEVFVKHDYYSSLRVKLIRKDGDKITLCQYLGDRIEDIGTLNTDKKIYPIPKGFFLIDLSDDYGYIYEDGDYSFYRYKYIKHKGSSRSSKSWSLEECAIRRCEETNGLRLTVWRDTKESLSGTIWKDFKKLFPMSGRSYKFPQDMRTIYFPNGATIEPQGDDSTNAHGLTQDIAWLNEPYKMSKETFDQIDQRSGQIWLDLNPKMGHWSDDLDTHPRCKVIHSTFQVNPFCPIEQRLKILSYDPSNPVNVANGTADPYMWKVYGLGEKAEKPNRIFSWNKITRAEYDALDCGVMYGVDWGKVDPWGIVEAKFYDGTLYLRELNYKSENELRKEMNVNESIKIGEDVEGTGIVVWMFERLGISKNAYIVCDNNRPLKIASLRRHGWEYAIPAEKPKGSIIDGIDLLQNIQVCFTDDSPNIEYEQENYSWKTDRYGINTEEPEDVDNHTIDPTRYIGLFLQSKGLLRVL